MYPNSVLERKKNKTQSFNPTNTDIFFCFEFSSVFGIFVIEFGNYIQIRSYNIVSLTSPYRLTISHTALWTDLFLFLHWFEQYVAVLHLLHVCMALWVILKHWKQNLKHDGFLVNHMLYKITNACIFAELNR